MTSETGPALPHRRRKRPVLRALWAVGIIFAALLPMAGIGAQSSPKNPGAVSEQVMDELRAANSARRQLLDETQAWQTEKEKLLLLKAAVEQEAAQLRAEAETDKSKTAYILENRSDAEMQRRKMRQMENILSEISVKLENDLDALAARHLPGIVPAGESAPPTDPLGRFSAAAQRLNDTRLNCQKAQIEIVEGQLDDETLTVKLLRAGAAAAWWLSLDGERGGTARRNGDGLVLTATDDARSLEEIKGAIATLEGFAAPRWTLLPLAPTENTSEARP